MDYNVTKTPTFKKILPVKLTECKIISLNIRWLYESYLGAIRRRYSAIPVYSMFGNQTARTG